MSGASGGFWERARERWHAAPLALVFVCYLVVYLVFSTVLTAMLINNVYLPMSHTTYTLSDGSVVSDSTPLYGGPYVYDAAVGDLVPAAQIELPNRSGVTVFVGIDPTHKEDAHAAAFVREDYQYRYATLEDARAGIVEVRDWGANFVSEEQLEEVLGADDPLDPDRIPEWVAEQSAIRVDAVGTLKGITASDALFSSDAPMSNIAFYVNDASEHSMLSRMASIAFGLLPFAIYGVFGWIAFRRFYRIYLAAPLADLEGAAQRIAESDLDFTVPETTGRELRHLSHAMEDMRASLLAAHRELWRTAEERRRLNAAFAHDLRTPVTVLKGSVEMAQMRCEAGDPVGAEALSTISAQVDRLERYAGAMSGLAKLEDRPVRREVMPAAQVSSQLAAQAHETVAAKAPELAVNVTVENAADAVAIDISLVEEVLGNLLNNACEHAVSHIELAVYATEASLAISVADDGAGFSPEALHRGCEPFYGEVKSAEHFGLGLNIVATLAHAHGGSVVLENDEKAGLGARVTVSFACSERA